MFPVYKNDVELCLRKHFARAQAIDWKTPLAIFLGAAVTLATSHFHDTIGIPAAVWASFYMVVGVVCVAFLLRAVYFLCFKRPMKLEQLVDEIIKSDPC